MPAAVCKADVVSFSSTVAAADLPHSGLLADPLGLGKTPDLLDDL
jgi:hypothetical protein